MISIVIDLTSFGSKNGLRASGNKTKYLRLQSSLCITNCSNHGLLEIPL